MTATEIDRRAQELYNSRIRSEVEAANRGRFIAIDVDSGDYEIGDDRLTISNTVRSRRPNATTGMLRIGYLAAGRIGGSARALAS